MLLTLSPCLPHHWSWQVVPKSARVGSLSEARETMLLDNAFGRWIQDLDGRRVVVILDTCYAGGQSSQMKGISDSPDYFDFIDSEVARTKDIGPDAAAMLCLSDAHEVSAERKEGDVSVMTFFLIKLILDGQQVTLTAAYDYVKREVPEYIKKRFPDREQTPILVGKIGEVYLRP